MPADTPDDVRRLLLEGGVADDDLLRRVISEQAKWIGMTFDEAVELHRSGSLPTDDIGSSIDLFLDVLFATV